MLCLSLLSLSVVHCLDTVLDSAQFTCPSAFWSVDCLVFSMQLEILRLSSFFFKEPFYFCTPVCSAVGSHLHHIMTADLRSMQQYRPQYNTKRPILQDLMNEYDD